MSFVEGKKRDWGDAGDVFLLLAERGFSKNVAVFPLALFNCSFPSKILSLFQR